MLHMWALLAENSAKFLKAVEHNSRAPKQCMLHIWLKYKENINSWL